jgi:hypothetical protein
MWYFSIFSGELFESETPLSDPHQIPLIRKPPTHCRKCYGRFFTDYNITTKQYTICNKCLTKCLNAEYMMQYFKEKDARKKN